MLGPAELRQKADWVRRQTLLLHKRCPETRLASSLSCVEILTALHYGGILRFDPANPRWEGRDRFIVSKGHGSISYYPILTDLGFLPAGELDRIARDDGVLKVIPDTAIAGYETINGSLGHGPGVACGIALGLKEKGAASRVYVLVGDGELNEGSVWEAVMLAAHQRLDNLVLVVDANGASMLDFCRNVLDLTPLAAKFEAFGWEAARADGHDLASLASAFAAEGRNPGKPLAVVAETVKGKGVPRLESDPLSHIKALTAAEVDALLGEAT